MDRGQCIEQDKQSVDKGNPRVANVKNEGRWPENQTWLSKLHRALTVLEVANLLQMPASSCEFDVTVKAFDLSWNPEIILDLAKHHLCPLPDAISMYIDRSIASPFYDFILRLVQC